MLQDQKIIFLLITIRLVFNTSARANDIRKLSIDVFLIYKMKTDQRKTIPAIHPTSIAPTGYFRADVCSLVLRSTPSVSAISFFI